MGNCQIMLDYAKNLTDCARMILENLMGYYKNITLCVEAIGRPGHETSIAV